MADTPIKNDISGISHDLISDNIAKLKTLFPHVVSEGGVDFDALQQALGKTIDTEHHYTFTWYGKRKAERLAYSPSRATLLPCENESKNWDSTENILIEGDNLEVLKCLQKSYANKIKMIYIDPPYNTGNDFVYNDDFTDNLENYLIQTGQKTADGKKTHAKSETAGRKHTKWLNMIYPRLLLARNLLREDGVIFISIDDNEQANLKKVCDEVFGEENFVSGFSRVTKKGGKASDSTAKNHDFVLMYTKSKDMSDLTGIPHNDSGYKYKDKYFDSRGYYKLNQTLDYDSLVYGNSLDYPIEIDGETFYAGGDIDAFNKRQAGIYSRTDWVWRWSKILFDFAFANDFVEIKRGGTRPRIYTKTYQNVKIDKIDNKYKIVNNERTKPLSTLEFNENIYSNDNAKKVFDTIMGKGIFEYTKPPSLIKKCMELIKGNDYIVLDFFAGSGTTAHAVINLNAQDGGNRKCISVQLPELTDEKSEVYNAGYTNIAEITKEHIRRAGDKILADNKDLTNLDIGFKVFKLHESNIKQWRANFDTIATDLFNNVDNMLANRTDMDKVTEIALKYGLYLHTPIVHHTTHHTPYYTVQGNDGIYKLFVFLHPNSPTNVTDIILKENSENYQNIKVVFADSCFDNADKATVYHTLIDVGIDGISFL